MSHSFVHDLLPWRHKALIWQFARKDLVLRYRGSSLGGLWAILAPLIMLAIYTTIFQYVFRVRWQTGSASTIDFALNLYAGLLLFNWFAETVSRAPRLILEQPYLVNKVVFPLPILAWAGVLSSSVQMLISLALWLIACWLAGHSMDSIALLVPLVPLMLLPWLLALTWFLSGIGVYLRDISQILPMVVTGLMFLSPVLYPIQALPNALQTLALANPLSPPIETLRALVLGASPISLWIIGMHAAAGCIAAVVAVKIFRRVSRYFSDVL